MKKDYLYLVAIVSLCFLFSYLNREDGHHFEDVSELVEVDTTKHFQPTPIKHERKEAFRVNIPRVIYVQHTDTAYIERVVVDSVEVEVPVESRTYQDSTYEARVSGPCIGGRGPTLDYVHIFNRTTTITHQEWPKRWLDVRASAGAIYLQNTADIWAGVEVDRHVGRWSYGGAVGYTLSGSPYVEARAGVRLFSLKK